jgi:hypothetical protein
MAILVCALLAETKKAKMEFIFDSSSRSGLSFEDFSPPELISDSNQPVTFPNKDLIVNGKE